MTKAEGSGRIWTLGNNNNNNNNNKNERRVQKWNVKVDKNVERFAYAARGKQVVATCKIIHKRIENSPPVQEVVKLNCYIYERGQRPWGMGPP